MTIATNIIAFPGIPPPPARPAYRDIRREALLAGLEAVKAQSEVILYARLAETVDEMIRVSGPEYATEFLLTVARERGLAINGR